MRREVWLAVAVSLALAARAAAQTAPPSPPPASAPVTTLPQIDVVATTPVGTATPGRGIERDKVPGTVETVTSEDLAKQHAATPLQALGQRTPGVSLSDVQGNENFQDLRYRGFAASPLQGTPQGIAVYQNGIRLNEAFGDTVNWDLIPTRAINRLDFFSNNPIFGLNALGGAANLDMKNGFTWQGFETELMGGSFGRIQGSLQYGAKFDDWSLYVTGDGMHEDGWRLKSPSDIKRVYGDVGHRGADSEFHFIAGGAWNEFGVVGPTPVQLSQANSRAIYTFPQATTNQMGMAAMTDRVDATPDWTLQGTLYVRHFDQRHVDGNTGDFEQCSARSSFGGQLCLEDDAFGTPPGGKTTAFRDQFAIVTPGGTTIPFTPGVNYGTVDRTHVAATTYGSSLQATDSGKLFGHGNTLIVGGSIDRAEFDFQNGSELAVVFPSFFTGPDPSVPGTGIGPIRTLGNLGYAPNNLDGANNYFGLYATDTFDLTEAASLTAGGRFNAIQIATNDRSGMAPELNARNGYLRFNPLLGLTYKLAPGLTAYAGYSESNRAPTPLELDCASATKPCLLENALVADPPLKQAVSHTYEAGLRATMSEPGGGTSRLKGGLFRTDIDSDIIALASTIQGRGFFANVPATQRQGMELAAEYSDDKWHLFANYSLIQATFQFTGTLASPNNPFADANGNILVRTGNHMPLVPRHQLKAGADYNVTPQWNIGAEIAAFSSQFLVGDESNQNAPLPAYWVANLRTSYQVTDHIQVFALINNLFDRRYATYGTFFETTATLTNPRTTTLAPPLSVFGGVKVTW